MGEPQPEQVDETLHALMLASAEIRTLECELDAIDGALRAERTPEVLTRSGKIRWLGDQRRAAERDNNSYWKR